MTIRDFRNIILIIITSIIITIILPGIISYINGTFYTENIKSRIPKEQQKKLESYFLKQNTIEQKLSNINDKLNSAIEKNDINSGTIDAYIKLKEEVKKEIDTKAPINLIPYYLNPQMLLWLGIYSAYMILIYLLLKQEKAKFKLQKKYYGLAFLIYGFYEWPLWVRNFILTSKGRTVYAYPNIDIDIASFFYQEIIILIFCFLSAILICICIEIYQKIDDIPKDQIGLNEFLIVSSYYSTSYRNWFVNSALLALGFLSFTSFFWRLVFVYGDQRYIISAINAHVIWALCWVAISLNLLYYNQQFDKTKREILRTNPDDNTIKIVIEHQPANNMTIILSGIGSILTFLAPLFKVIFEK